MANIVEKVRHFNRFYTQILGLLDRKFLKSEYSLAEARILFELGQSSDLLARDLSSQLHLDPAYLSRLLNRFEKQGLIRKQVSAEDTRKQLLSLTTKGEAELAVLQEISHAQIAASLDHIDQEGQAQLVKAMETIEGIFTGKQPQSDMFTLRSHRPGDIGYISYRHGVLYSQSHGFDVSFDAYVASAMAEFVTQYDPKKEHLWVVEHGSTIIGSIAIVKAEEDVAQLRWFLVEPQARGKGLGKKLIHEALEFCKGRNYRKIILWTVSKMETARRLYARNGFQMTETNTHRLWGQELTEELWERELELTKRSRAIPAMFSPC